MLSVHQHWNPLKTCVVGRCYPPEYFNYIENLKVRGVFHRIAEETEEDYQKLISVLDKFDVNVIRTDITDNPDDYRRSDGSMKSPPMIPRDYIAMIGDKFFMPGENFGKNIDFEEELKGILNASSLQAKHMSDVHKDILQFIYDLTIPGRPVSPATQVMLLKNLRGKNNRSVKEILSQIDIEDLKNIIFQGSTNTIGKTSKYTHDDKTYPFRTLEKFVKENGNDIIYDQYINTASMTRLGKDLIFGIGNIMNKLNEENFQKKWKKLFPDYNVKLISVPGHSDGSFCPVKPGLIISTKTADYYADTFPGWEVVTLVDQGNPAMKPWIKNKKKNAPRYWVPDAGEVFYDYVNEWMDDWVTYVEETIFDLNMLVIDEKNVIVNNHNDLAFDAFERHGVTPHIVNFRHRYFWDGGLHCITSDIDREGEQQDFKEIMKVNFPK